MFLRQEQFNSICKNFNLAIQQLIIFGLFFLIASCSTQGSSRKGTWYPEKPERYGKNQNYKFDYRKNRLLKEKKPPYKVKPDMDAIANLKEFKHDMGPASLNRVINNQLRVLY